MSTELQRTEVPQDGVSIMDVRYHLLGPIAPPAEMISEFRVASVSAAYSQMGDVAIITKAEPMRHTAARSGITKTRHSTPNPMVVRKSSTKFLTPSAEAWATSTDPENLRRSEQNILLR
jgi:hypothetical protein